MGSLGLSGEQLITTTRAVRRRLDLHRPVAMDDIVRCLEMAVQAPSGGNAQDWRWVVVTDAQTRGAIAEAYRSSARETFDRRSRDGAGGASGRLYESARDLADVLHLVPVLVLVCSLRARPSDHATAAGFYGSIFPAIWNFQLALRSQGLGSTLTTAHLRNASEIADAVGIPSGVAQVALLPVAHTIGTEFKPAPRSPVREVAYHNRWGAQLSDGRTT